MIETLPPDRDLPPHRQARIRATLVRTASEPPPRRWVAPALTAAIAIVALGLVMWFVPLGGEGGGRAAAPTATSTSTTASAPTPTTVPGTENPELVSGCAASAIVGGTFTLKHVLTDAAGTFAVIYSDDMVLGCEVGGPVMKYNAGFATLEKFRPPVSVDYAASVSGGNDSKPEYEGTPGYEVVVGRVTPEVVRVTYTQGEDTVEGTVVNGIYVARVVRSADWMIQEGNPPPQVSAYDANGNLLGTASPA